MQIIAQIIFVTSSVQSVGNQRDYLEKRSGLYEWTYYGKHFETKIEGGGCENLLVQKIYFNFLLYKKNIFAQRKATHSL